MLGAILNSNFWIWFFLLNLLFFIPLYLLHFKETDFFPRKGFKELTTKRKFGFPFFRRNYDLFRVNGDFALGSLLVYLLPNNFSIAILIALFLIGLIYQIYHYAIAKIYVVKPVLYNDLTIIKSGIDIFYYPHKILFSLGILLLLGLLFGLGYLVFYYASVIQNLSLSLVELGLITGLGILGLYLSYRYKREEYAAIAFPSPILRLWNNLSQSIIAHKFLSSVKDQPFEQFNLYDDLKLEQRPNIIVLAIESYGSVVFNKKDTKDYYQKILEKSETSLTENGWHIGSNLSTSPILGGGSWMSYSSMEYGLKIDNLGLFNTLFYHKPFLKYKSLYANLQSKGYTSYRLNAMGGFQDLKINWEQMCAFHAADHFLRFKDLDYDGKLFGMGNTPPDQYSLNKAFEIIKEKQTTPFSLFFVTHNSHFWFETPTVMAEHWKDTNNQDLDFLKIVKDRNNVEKNYQAAIKYQFEFITDFITNQLDDDTIVLLYGDHQPPMIPTKEDGLETPVHIISKNKKFVEGFSEYGFEEGMLIRDLKNNNLRHEGIYSMFMRELYRHYSSEKELPPYLPEGINLVKP